MTLSVRYDEEPQWQPLAEIHSTGLGSMTIPVAVRRCDHLRLRLEGTGELTLFDLTKTVMEGSDVF